MTKIDMKIANLKCHANELIKQRGWVGILVCDALVQL